MDLVRPKTPGKINRDEGTILVYLSQTKTSQMAYISFSTRCLDNDIRPERDVLRSPNVGWGCPNPLKEILPELFQNLGDGQQKIGKVIYRWTEPSLEPYISFIFILVVLPYGAAFITKLLILCDSVKIIFAFMHELTCRAAVQSTRNQPDTICKMLYFFIFDL